MKSHVAMRIAVYLFAATAIMGSCAAEGERAATQPVFHPMWALTSESARGEYVRGGAVEKMGKPIASLYDMVANMRAHLDNITLYQVCLMPPDVMLSQMGWSGEHDLYSEKEKQNSFNALYPGVLTLVMFHVDMTAKSDLDALSSVRFVCENDKGDKLRLESKGKANIKVEQEPIFHSVWYACTYNPRFYITGEDGAPLITDKTKWIRFWTITASDKYSATFYLDGTKKVEVGR
jgi:hypothetical protein